MHILCIGINHQTSPVSLRERLAFTDELLASSHPNIDPDSGAAELVVLSTCNRVEVYAALHAPDFTPLEAFLSLARGIPLSEFNQHLYRMRGPEAVQHLFQVTAGLDSLVLGEPQILGQVIHALEIAQANGMAGPTLGRLFQAAVHAGKRVRSETNITRNPASIPSVAVRLAADLFTDLPKTTVAVLGAGEMANLVVESLRKRGATRFTVVNRSLDNAHKLAGSWTGQAAAMEDFPTVLSSADILIASSATDTPLVGLELVSTVMAQRPDRPLLMIDIGVPRNIDPGVRQAAGVSLYDLDDLQDYLRRSLALREQEMPGAWAILAEEQEVYFKYQAASELFPLIKELQQQAESIRQAELEKTLRRMPDLSDDERRRIEVMTEALVNKLLHGPITRLRDEAQCTHMDEFSYVARSLFGLSDEHGCCGFSKECMK